MDFNSLREMGQRRSAFTRALETFFNVSTLEDAPVELPRDTDLRLKPQLSREDVQKFREKIDALAQAGILAPLGNERSLDGEELTPAAKMLCLMEDPNADGRKRFGRTFSGSVSLGVLLDNRESCLQALMFFPFVKGEVRLDVTSEKEWKRFPEVLGRETTKICRLLMDEEGFEKLTQTAVSEAVHQADVRTLREFISNPYRFDSLFSFFQAVVFSNNFQRPFIDSQPVMDLRTVIDLAATIYRDNTNDRHRCWLLQTLLPHDGKMSHEFRDPIMSSVLDRLRGSASVGTGNAAQILNDECVNYLKRFPDRAVALGSESRERTMAILKAACAQSAPDAIVWVGVVVAEALLSAHSIGSFGNRDVVRAIEGVAERASKSEDWGLRARGSRLKIEN